ncbi:aldehyde dehydrogenase family protein [Enhygromyxa salina]|uniref:aldehyde dehydrogenase family protein n=1 Tax=Enhygromyxa salina TaxID=215803 RepID=UPI0015E6161D|nr:aldehyde dehydrogenase family protein [Enhygromyxa salina]
MAEIRANADRWVETGVEIRLKLLREVMIALEAEADAWVATSCKLKGIEPGTNPEGQEWLSGFLAIPRSVRYLIHTLEHDGKPPPVSQRRRSTPDGDQWIVRVFPQTLLDKALFTGWNIDLWLEPGAPAEQGGIYRRKAAGETWPGKVALVMGAGNQIFLGPTDMLHKLFIDDEVVVLKMNPVNEVDGPHIERAFKPLIDAGFVRVVYGGLEVGKHLCTHPEVDTIHVTGSDATHDAIVWGADPIERERRKASGERLNERPFTSELGCVSPYFITPGPWTERDLDYHARQLAAALTQNAGHNCAAPQVLLVASGWDQRDEFVARVEQAIAASPPRISYYPGSTRRWEEFCSKYPQHKIIGRKGEGVVPWTLVSDVPMTSGEWALTCEGFCGLLNIVDIPTDDPAEFLAKAVPFANDELWGNLSCSLIVHPKTRKAHPEAVEGAIAELRYGTVAVNGWAGAGCALMVSGWGGYPGNTQEDVQSGIGMAHNNLLWEPLLKSVIDLPFRVQPKPPWFVDHRNLPAMGRALVMMEFKPGLGRLFPVLGAALTG